MKRKADRSVIVAVSCLAAILIGITCFYTYMYFSAEAHDLCGDICLYGWERYISYPMLSAELKGIISEEEFSDRTPEGKLRMYEKLNGLVLDDRPDVKFDGSTSWFKSPCYDIIERNGESDLVELRIDLAYRFGKLEVRNFTACISSPKGRNEE